MEDVMKQTLIDEIINILKNENTEVPDFTSYSRRPKARRAYFSKVEKQTGLPLESLVNDFTARGLKLRACLDLSGTDVRLHGAPRVYVSFYSADAPALLSFSLPSRRAHRVGRSNKRRGV
jgi:hypothetical protein